MNAHDIIKYVPHMSTGFLLFFYFFSDGYTQMRTMVLEYLPTFTLKMTQSSRFLYSSTMVRIWDCYTFRTSFCCVALHALGEVGQDRVQRMKKQDSCAFGQNKT